VLASLAAFASQAAVIYKWTDAEGVVHYSDQSVPGAQKIYTSGPTTTGGSTGAQPNPASQAPITLGPSNAPKQMYSILAISSPTPEQTFFGDDPIGAALALEPSLKPGDTITWHLNGRQLDDAAPTATQFALPRLDRGTYAIAATITDSTGQSQSTPSVTFYVRQPSALAPQQRKP